MKNKKIFNRKSPTLLIGIIALFVLYNCGGDGGGNDSNITESTGTISGSVSGTTILALDDDGLIVASDNTKRRLPDMDLDVDGINESYSFTIYDVPVGENIRIYLVESEGVSPMYFDEKGNPVNVFSLSSASDINLGFVDSNDGIAIPEYNPTHAPNIDPEGADKELKPISQVVPGNFAGTWNGDVFYIVGTETGTADITITLSKSGGSLVGTFHFYEKTYEGTEERIEDWTVNVAGTVSLSGALSFPLPKPYDLENNPDCDTWNISLTAILPEPSTMDIDFDGTVCSGRYGNFSDFIYKQ